MKFDSKKTIFLIDGSSFLYRAYYGMRPLHTSKGVPVHAVYSFARMIKKLMDQFKPEYMSVVWDSPGKTKRHETYEEYKATRQAPPSDLFEQKDLIVDFAKTIGLHQAAQPGLEADDIMYSIAKEQLPDHTIVLVTSDKDMGQMLTSESVYLYDSFKEQFVHKAAFEEKYGFPIERLPFYFSLLGDSSDNIPGVRGIGKKGAQELAQQFESLEDLYARIDEIKKPRTKNALLENKQNAFLSRDLFLLQYDPTDITIKDLKFNSRHWSRARELFTQLEFKSLLRDMGISKEQREHIIEAKLKHLKTLDLKCVTTAGQLQELCADLREKGLFAIDTETDGLRPLEATLVGLSFCTQEGTAYYVPCAHKNADHLPFEQIRDALLPIFEDPAIGKYLHNIKFDKHVLAHAGIPMQGEIFDSQLAASLVMKEGQRTGLKSLSIFFYDEHMLSFEDVVKHNKYKDFSYAPLDIATYYSAFDAHQTFKLSKLFEQKLKDEGMDKLYYEIEFPLVKILYEMEKAGIYADFDTLKSLNEQINVAIDLVKAEILKLIGDEHKDINLNSPRQIQQLLFESLQLPPVKKSFKKTGYSTDSYVLEILAKMHPVPALILKYRELYKIKSTYIEALPEYINPHDKRIHTTFSQTRVATGRLSSIGPNLQNVPASGPGLVVRKAFRPKEGNLFISADYSQIELRVLAYLSQDATLLQAFKEHKDIHAQTAAGLFDAPIESITHEQRQIGKRINFSILYGLTPFGLSKDLGISFGQAKEYIDKYFAHYPGVKKWMESIIDQVEKQGYVTTHWGRRRYVPGIYERNKMLQEEAKRVAINTVAQGTASEIVKQGMLVLNAQLANLDGAMLLQIHDEIIISVPEPRAEEAQGAMKKALEGVVDWNVPLEVKTTVGRNWKAISK